MISARISRDGAKIRCGRAQCDGLLGTVITRDMRRLKRNYPGLPDIPDVALLLFVGEGFHHQSDGTWRIGAHAARRIELGLAPKDRRKHEISAALPRIVSGQATPEEHEAFQDLLAARGVALPEDHAIRELTVVYCPKCCQPNTVDPDRLHIQHAQR